jgi:hypothetical protein
VLILTRNRHSTQPSSGHKRLSVPEDTQSRESKYYCLRRWCNNSFNTPEELLDHITPRSVEEYRKSLPEFRSCSSCGKEVRTSFQDLETAVEIQRLSSSNGMTIADQKTSLCSRGFAQSVCYHQECPGKKAEWYIGYQRERIQAEVCAFWDSGRLC